MSVDRYQGLLRRVFPGARVLEVAPLEGGVSADVRWVDVERSDGERVSVVVRTLPDSASALTSSQEFELLRALREHAPGVPVPEPLAVDESMVMMSFVDGSGEIAVGDAEVCVAAMADMLAAIHCVPVAGLPELPQRVDPLESVLDYVPRDASWDDVRSYLGALDGTADRDAQVFLHGDFWPGNLLWRGTDIAAVLDWEDAAIGDPQSDLAVCRVELRYKFGPQAMAQVTEAYERHHQVDHRRLALWQIYVAAAAQHFMGGWGLDPALEAHMRTEAHASIREAADLLMARSG